jgi:cupin superfamily acireductone dioxygenase involved in methionine salvage
MISEFLEKNGLRSTVLEANEMSTVEKHIAEKNALNKKHKNEVDSIIEKYNHKDADEYKMHRELSPVHEKHNKEIEEMGIRHKKERGL